jgi:hypothetical protein
VKESRNAMEDIKNALRRKYKRNSHPESFEKECFFFHLLLKMNPKEQNKKKLETVLLRKINI